MAAAPAGTLAAGNEFLIIVVIILIFRMSRFINGQRFSGRIFFLPAIYILLIAEFVVYLSLEQLAVVVALAVVALPIGTRVGGNPEFFFRNEVLYFKRSFILMVVWLGALVVRIVLEILYTNPSGTIEFIITGLLAMTLGLIAGERVMIYRKGTEVLRTGKIEKAEEGSTMAWAGK